MNSAKTFRDLVVWQKAHAFVVEVYRYTNNFPREEMYGLSSQFKRSAISIASNIAEGFKKRGKRDKANYMNIAQGSVEECRYYIILSRDLSYGANQLLDEQLDEISKMLDSYYYLITHS